MSTFFLVRNNFSLSEDLSTIKYTENGPAAIRKQHNVHCTYIYSAQKKQKERKKVNTPGGANKFPPTIVRQ